MTRRLTASLLVAACLTTSASAATLLVSPNVNINRQTGYQAETAVAINPTNPSQLFAWSNDLSGSSRNSAAFSTDGGATWTPRFTGSDGWPGVGGDPTCSFDAFGNLYAATFNSSFSSILVRASTNGGQTFSTALTPTITGSLDQPTIKAGPGPAAGTQAAWITYLSGSSLVARGLTSNGLGSYNPFGLALAIPGSSGGNFGDIAIGPTGKVAVTFQTPSSGSGPSTIMLAVNASGGTSSSFLQAAATIATNVGGFRPIPAQPSRTVDSEVGLAYDTSNGPHRGRLYMTYTDAPTTTSNDLNIFLRYSDNDGASWTAPKKINTDATANSQFFPKIALDPTTGNVGLAWYDCRNSATNDHEQLFGTVSLDGGDNFLPEVQISAGTSYGVGAGSGNELGDYIGLDFYNNVLYPVWADNSNSTGDNPNGTANFDYYGAAVTVAVPEPAALSLLAPAALVLFRRRRPRP